MKKLLLIAILIFGVIGTASAQNAMYAGAGLEVALPIGDWSDWTSLGIGGTGSFEIEFQKNLVGVANVGYIAYGGKDFGGADYSLSAIPILAGAKYFFNSDFYGFGQIGVYILSVSVDIPVQSFGGFTYGGGSQSTSSTEFGLVIGAGYEKALSPNLILDLAAKFGLISDANQLGFRAGVKFPIGK